ncbi:abortive infection family protein [Rummeliibacillus pycnus]|uniref:abortive infection family protein n=1 Tax=Rummeliibacillus pycnus TaxID=101070 RepID=UPI000C9BCFFE|nr:abortive infection family protein [Rummeliibacillus pycnus]
MEWPAKVDRIWFEKLFKMNTGYVLNFSNASFQQFVLTSTGRDILSDEYSNYGTSKANRLRSFWDKEDESVVYNLLKDLVRYWKECKDAYEIEITSEEEKDYQKCLSILESFTGSISYEKLDKLYVDVLNISKSMPKLVTDIKENMKNNKPELALDRLHTFSMQYFRSLCKKHNIGYVRDDALHTIFKNYREYIEQLKVIDSTMTIQILKSTTNLLNEYNKVRNHESFAHPNEVLNTIESKLICDNMVNIIKFCDQLEEVIDS